MSSVWPVNTLFQTGGKSGFSQTQMIYNVQGENTTYPSERYTEKETIKIFFSQFPLFQISTRRSLIDTKAF